MAERSTSTEVRSRPLPGGYGWYYFDAISLDGRYVFIASWHSGFLFSPDYYDEVLELRDRDWAQLEDGTDLADPTNFGAFCLGLYDRRRTEAYVMVEAPLVRGGSDPWFPNLHGGDGGLGSGSPLAGTALGVGENRVTLGQDGSFTMEFSDRSKWLRTSIQGSLRFRPLTVGSSVIELAQEGAQGMEVPHEWQILAPRAEVTGKIQWTGPLARRGKSLDFAGLGYIDRNAGRLPVSPHVGRWLWGRFQGSEKTVVYYRLDPADAPLDTGDGGRGGAGETERGSAREFLYLGDRNGGELVADARVDALHVRRNRWGMPHPLEVALHGRGERWKASVARDIDRGPFNVRSLSRLSCEDPALDGVIGVTECFVPARWDVPLYRLFSKGRIRRGP